MKSTTTLTHFIAGTALFIAGTANALPIGTQHFSTANHRVVNVEPVNVEPGFVASSADNIVVTTDGSTASTSGQVSGPVIDPATTEAFAEANLSAGTLRASASVSDYNPFYLEDAQAVGRSAFGDSFTHSSGGNPFIFSSGTSSIFSLTVDGISSRSTNDGHTSTASFLNIFILEHGTLANNVRDNGFLQVVDSSYQAVLHNDLIAHASYGLTPDADLTTNYDATGGISTVGEENPFILVPVDGILSNGDSIDFAFQPGGDFDWYIELVAGASISNGPFPGTFPLLGTQHALSDFSNTIHVDYFAPSGVSYASASGVFLNSSTSGNVPEASTLPLLTLGGLMLVAFRRKTQLFH